MTTEPIGVVVVVLVSFFLVFGVKYLSFALFLSSLRGLKKPDVHTSRDGVGAQTEGSQALHREESDTAETDHTS